MKARFRKPLAMFLVVMMLFTLMPAGMAFGEGTEDVKVEIIGNQNVVMQKDVTFFDTSEVNEGYYSLTTSPSGVRFETLEWSDSGNLPEGITLSVNSADWEKHRIKRAFFAGTPKAMTNGKVLVTITATATDADNKEYTDSIDVYITVEDTPVDKKLEKMIDETECKVSMTDANTPDEVVKWIKETWLPRLGVYDEYVEEYGELAVVALPEGIENEIEGFKEPVAGTAANPGGENGSLYVQFPLDEEGNQFLGSAKKCIILATPYSSGGGSSTNSYTPPVEKPDEDAWEYFSFSNSENDFFTANEPQNYSMDEFDKDFEAALKKLYPNNWIGTLNDVRAEERSEWGGSCYGFASVELLANLGLLNIVDYYAQTNSLPIVKAPVDTTDKDVRSLLNYYYLTQFVPAMRNFKDSDGPNSDIKSMAENVVNGERYMFSYVFGYLPIGDAPYGHTIILDGGEKHANGSYTLKGYDNRYHKYFWAKNKADERKVEGTPVFIDIKIDSSGNCTVEPPTGNITMQGDTRNTYSFSGGSTEYVSRYEVMLADESSTMVKRYAAFMPEGEEVTAVKDKVVYLYVSGWRPENVAGKVCYIAGATNAPTVSGNQVIVNKAVESAATLTVLDKADDITIDNPTGRQSLVDGNFISSVTVTKASSTTLSTNNGTAEIKDNNGKFTMQVTAQIDGYNYTVYTITGSGKGNVKAAATANGVEIEKDGTITTSVTSETFTTDLRIVLQINNKNIVINNRTITNDVAPVIVDNRTLVPVRIVTELLGGTADWDAENRTVTLTIDGKVLTLVIDEEIPGYGTGATIIDNRTYVPIRYIAEKLGANVEWVAETRQIIIEK